MIRAGRSLLFLLALAGTMLPAFATPIVATDAPRLNLADKVEWCESPDQAAVTATAPCQFSVASPGDLRRGLTKRAIWLRLTLVNSGKAPTERWLQIGHPRLMHVIFFEKTEAGWHRSEAGMAVPLAKRQVHAIDPMLAVRLEPSEIRTIVVRITSLSAVDATPILWQPNAYQLAAEKGNLHSSIGTGALLASAIFLLSIYFLWNAKAYLHLCVFTFSVIAFSVSHSGLLQLYFWPENWPFDVRIQALPGAFIGISFAMFAGDFADSRTLYRRHHTLLMILSCATLLAGLWVCLIDFQQAALIVVFLVLTTMAVAGLLLLRQQPRALGKLRIALIVIAGFMIIRAFMIGIDLTHGLAGDIFLISQITVFLLAGMPATLFGLAMHKQRMQMQLVASQAESAARVNFLARMSHELRTPLDVIIGTAQLLSRPNHRARLQEGLADISVNARQLLKMIDEVLDYSRGLAGKLTVTPEPVNWPDFLRSTKRAAEILASRSGSTVTLDSEGETLDAVCVDERRLRQVLDNLIANAARHTTNGHIALRCGVGACREDNKRTIAFTVSDSGEGIPPEDLERIFKPFERGGNAVQHGGKGVGMGLAISRQLVELMGGKLSVESKKGEGASFRFQIIAEPADAADAKAPLLERISGYAGVRRTILVVDDESDNRFILAAMLRDSGFDVIEADSGRSAVAMLETPVDAVLTDQFMTDGDGWYVLREVAGRMRAVPVILVSAAPPDRPDGFPAQIDFADRLLKPLDHSEVLRCLGDLLGLEWIETGEVAPAEKPLLRPGDAALHDLREMIEAGRVSDIMIWADELKARDQACELFADQVRDAAINLDFATLRDLTSDTNTHKTGNANLASEI
jgi:signal transduction histidine kinase/CheY-like chemotaxis protein